MNDLRSDGYAALGCATALDGIAKHRNCVDEIGHGRATDCLGWARQSQERLALAQESAECIGKGGLGTHRQREELRSSGTGKRRVRWISNEPGRFGTAEKSNAWRRQSCQQRCQGEAMFAPTSGARYPLGGCGKTATPHGQSPKYYILFYWRKSQ